jgi:hypothetical protein
MLEATNKVLSFAWYYIFANIIKVATRITYTTLFRKETSFIVNIENLTYTFYLTVTYRKSIA